MMKYSIILLALTLGCASTPDCGNECREFPNDVIGGSDMSYDYNMDGEVSTLDYGIWLSICGEE